MPIYSSGSKVCPISTSLLVGEINFIFRTYGIRETVIGDKATADRDPVLYSTLRSIISEGRENSSTMHTGMAPPQGLALSIFRSNKTHSILCKNLNKKHFIWLKRCVHILSKHTGFLAKASAAHAPEGPPPITATLNFRELVIGEAAAMLKADKRITETNMIALIFEWMLVIIWMQLLEAAAKN